MVIQNNPNYLHQLAISILINCRYKIQFLNGYFISSAENERGKISFTDWSTITLPFKPLNINLIPPLTAETTKFTEETAHGELREFLVKI